MAQVQPKDFDGDKNDTGAKEKCFGMRPCFPCHRKKAVKWGACYVLSSGIFCILIFSVLSNMSYEMIFHQVTKPCAFADNSPDNWVVFPPQLKENSKCPSNDLNTSKYFVTPDMATLTEVKFPSRDPTLVGELSGTFMNASSDSIVIFVHGVTVCRGKYENMLPSYFLAKMGISALLFDYRNHGLSPDSEFGYQTFGHMEHWDVLGAIDYANKTLGFPLHKIAIHGTSMGGATAIVAFSKHTEGRYLWLDAPVTDVKTTLMHASDGAFGMPGSFWWDVLGMLGPGKPHGMPPFANAPSVARKNFPKGSNVFIVTSKDDKTVPFSNAVDAMADWDADPDVNATSWYTSNCSPDKDTIQGCSYSHVTSMLCHPVLFEHKYQQFMLAFKAS